MMKEYGPFNLHYGLSSLLYSEELFNILLDWFIASLNENE